jgi:hypothetical protein
MFDELLVRTQHEPTKINAIEEEQRDFVAAIRTGKTPRVDGLAGRDAVAIAELILDRIRPLARRRQASPPGGLSVPGQSRWQIVVSPTTALYN